MDHRTLDELAARVGIAPGYRGTDGAVVETSASTKRSLLEGLGISLDGPLPTGRVEPIEGAKAKARCHLPRWLRASPAWGITGQLYELRSSRSWGIGDFADLETLCTIAARHGADFVGLTPLHAPFLADPQRCSPFSPSNRHFLNPLHIAVDRIEGFDSKAHRPQGLDEIIAAPLVDYPRVAAKKLAALTGVWRSRGGSASAWREFETYRAGASVKLMRHALFEALSARMVKEGFGAGWRGWPEIYRDPEGEAVTAFADGNADEVAFHLWLQFLAERQLASAARVAHGAGMRIGLYLDLAVGEEPDGSATWSAAADYVAGATIGAPPDYFSTQGQDWGIAALSPLALKRQNFAQFEELIADAARHAGALRIDHVMALQQLFLVPEGAGASLGAHLRYPIEELLQKLAVLSRERQFLVIGEDLGHVPEGFRERMSDAAILSYRILYFEQSERGFRRGRDYPRRSIACLSTHDLPTFRGWWQAHDVELRLEHGLIDAESADHQRTNRDNERRALVKLLGDGRPRPREWQRALEGPDRPPPDSLAVAVHGFLSESNALLAGVRIADLTGEDEPTNLPGTSGSYPNWCRRMRVPLEEMEEMPLFREVTARMAIVRPRR